jgi:hypothetical protein
VKELLGRKTAIESLVQRRRRESRVAKEKARPATPPSLARSPDDGFLFLLRLAAIADALWRPLLALVVIAALAWLAIRIF